MKMTQREKLLVTLLAVCALVWLEYTYLIKNQMESYELTKADLAIYQQKLVQLEKAPTDIKALDQKMIDLQSSTVTVLDKQFTTTQQEELILLLNDLLDNTGVTATDIGFDLPTAVVTDDETLYQMPITISMSGNYESLMTFFKKVWGFQKMLVIDQLDLGMATTDTGAATDAIAGSMTLFVYYMKVPEGIVYQDNLYQWIVDDTFFKGNPFKLSPGATDFRINAIFTGGKDIDAAGYVPFTDIKGHWAEKEINAFGEQGYIKKGQTDTFGPDTPMTRGEFIVMIDGIYQWPVPAEPADLTQFTDYDNLGSYANAISKAVVKGLLGGYVEGFDDKTLRPRDPITYSDVEYMLQRIKNDPAFNWEIVAEKLLAEKNVVSAGVEDKAAQMTKAEAVFLMTYFK